MRLLWRPGHARRTRKRRPRLSAPGPALLPAALRRETLCKVLGRGNDVQPDLRAFEESLRQIGAARQLWDLMQPSAAATHRGATVCARFQPVANAPRVDATVCALRQLRLSSFEVSSFEFRQLLPPLARIPRPNIATPIVGCTPFGRTPADSSRCVI